MHKFTPYARGARSVVDRSPDETLKATNKFGVVVSHSIAIPFHDLKLRIGIGKEKGRGSFASHTLWQGGAIRWKPCLAMMTYTLCHGLLIPEMEGTDWCCQNAEAGLGAAPRQESVTLALHIPIWIILLPSAPRSVPPRSMERAARRNGLYHSS